MGGRPAGITQAHQLGKPFHLSLLGSTVLSPAERYKIGNSGRGQVSRENKFFSTTYLQKTLWGTETCQNASSRRENGRFGTGLRTDIDRAQPSTILTAYTATPTSPTANLRSRDD